MCSSYSGGSRTRNSARPHQKSFYRVVGSTTNLSSSSLNNSSSMTATRQQQTSSGYLHLSSNTGAKLLLSNPTTEQSMDIDAFSKARLGKK